jgi:XisI protein
MDGAGNGNSRGNYPMDRLEQYRSIVQEVLTEYASVPFSHGEIEAELIFDKERVGAASP